MRDPAPAPTDPGARRRRCRPSRAAGPRGLLAAAAVAGLGHAVWLWVGVTGPAAVAAGVAAATAGLAAGWWRLLAGWRSELAGVLAVLWALTALGSAGLAPAAWLAAGLGALAIAAPLASGRTAVD